MIPADIRSITLRDTVGKTGSARHSAFSVNATKLLGTFATEREALGMSEKLTSSAVLDHRKIVLLKNCYTNILFFRDCHSLYILCLFKRFYKEVATSMCIVLLKSAFLPKIYQKVTSFLK